MFLLLNVSSITYNKNRDKLGTRRTPQCLTILGTFPIATNVLSEICWVFPYVGASKCLTFVFIVSYMISPGILPVEEKNPQTLSKCLHHALSQYSDVALCPGRNLNLNDLTNPDIILIGSEPSKKELFGLRRYPLSITIDIGMSNISYVVQNALIPSGHCMTFVT